MLAGITKNGSKTFIHIDALESIYSKLQALPAKKKTVFDLRDAVEYLSPAILDAVEKNYTKEDIFNMLGNFGWEITQATWRYVWSIIRSNENFSRKKKVSLKNVSKKKENALSYAKKSHSKLSIDANNYLENKFQSDINESASQNETSESKGVLNNNTAQDKSLSETVHNKAFQSQSRAYFTVQPDTEDL